MAKFCVNCGAPLEEGKQCPCSLAAGSPAAGSPAAGSPAAGSPAAGSPAAGSPADGSAAQTNTPVQNTPTQSAPPPQYQQPAQYAPPYQPPYYPSAQPDGAVDTIKAVVNSSAFMGAAIMYTFGLLLQFLQLFVESPVTSLMDRYRDVLGNLGLGDVLSMYELDRSFQASYTASSMFGLIVPGLVCIGIWAFFFSVRNAQTAPVPTAGLTMVKVIFIVQFVTMILVFAIIIVAFAAIAAASGSGMLDLARYGISSYQFDQETLTQIMRVAFIAAGAVMLFVFVMLIAYLVSFVKTVNTVTRSLRSGRITGKVSMFLIVINFIVAIFGILGALGNVLLGLTGSAASGLIGLSSFCVSVSLIMFSVCMNNLRQRIKQAALQAAISR